MITSPMPSQTLQLVFAPCTGITQNPESFTVVANESGDIPGVTGMPCREFYSEDYEELNLAVHSAIWTAADNERL